MFVEKTAKDKFDIDTIVKSNRDRLAVETYATISGIQGKQFGREIFSTIIKFDDLLNFLEAFQEVQRNIIPAKVRSMKRYILSGLGTVPAMRFFPAITATARGNIFYSEGNNRLAIDTRNSKLSINDGQHRFYAVAAAISELEEMIPNSSDHEKREKIVAYLKELKDMAMPLVIFNNLTEAEERQLFHDTNNLAQRPSRNATIRLAETDIYAQITRDIAKENRYLKHLGVEMDKGSIQGKDNPNAILLTTVYRAVKYLVSDLTKENLEDRKEYVHEVFNDIFRALPGDLKTKGKYIFDKSYTFKGICQFYAENQDLGIAPQHLIIAIKQVNWLNDVDFWGQYGGSLSKTGRLMFNGSDDSGRFSILRALEDQLKTVSKSNVTKLRAI